MAGMVLRTWDIQWFELAAMRPCTHGLEGSFWSGAVPRMTVTGKAWPAGLGSLLPYTDVLESGHPREFEVPPSLTVTAMPCKSSAAYWPQTGFRRFSWLQWPELARHKPYANFGCLEVGLTGHPISRSIHSERQLCGSVGNECCRPTPGIHSSL